MEFKFTVLDYQTRASDAVVRVFDGQPKVEVLSYVRDIGAGNVDKRGQMTMGAIEANDGAALDDGSGFRNAPLRLTPDELFDNVKKTQRKNGIPVSDALQSDLGAVELDVEMETGTGKTYVYTQTMFELNARYGWSKFIVVVPSVAIREGVAKSFEITAKHFHERYGKRLWSFVYNSSRLNEIDSFASRADISVVVINMQAFNAFDESKSKDGRGGDKAARIMFSERDDFGGRRPIDVLSATNPILIIDEPQKMGRKSGATRKAMRQFKPLFSLNYSATHKEHHNTVFALDPLDAYNERLVKRIEVKGVEAVGMRGTDGYVYLQDIRVSPSKPPVAVIEYKRQRANGTIVKHVGNFGEGDNLYHASNELEAYAHGYRILRIVPEQNGQDGYVEFDSHEKLYRGRPANDSSEEDVRRIQIRETIASHLLKEEALFQRGIKCLSLFFVDEVAKYRVYDEYGTEGVGEYGRIFEEEYARAVENRIASLKTDDLYESRYVDYLRRFAAHDVHKGYFAVDKNKRAIDSKLKRGSEFAEGEDAVAAYDLILRNKERLLSFEEPCRFIFSHSALREGWDNPNVFQICTLKEAGDSDISKRQEVGRGLRLCVDQEGTRQDAALLGRDGVHRVNLLTVIASEGYDSFVKSLQSETQAELRERPKKVEEKLFVGAVVAAGSADYTLTSEDAEQIMYALQANRLIDSKGRLTDKFREQELRGVAEEDIPEHLRGCVDQLALIVRSVEDAGVSIPYDNGFDTKVESNKLNGNFRKKEFQELWARINRKHAYTVEFDSDELRRNAVAKINAELTVSTPRYRVKQAAQRSEVTREQLEAAEGFGESSSKTVAIDGGDVANVTYDLVGEVADKARITRRSAAAILSEIAPVRFGEFRVNPEEFIAKAAALIVEAKARMVVEHIRYNRVADEYDAAEIFAEDMPESLSRALPTAKKGVQDWTVVDSDIERKFAQDLEESSEVCVFAHLPRSFSIPTPVGGYAPDWAIAFNEGVVKHIYFVAETKGSLSTMSLKGVEAAKIECARKLFEQLGEEGVRYDFVSTYDELLDKVMR